MKKEHGDRIARLIGKLEVELIAADECGFNYTASCIEEQIEKLKKLLPKENTSE